MDLKGINLKNIPLKENQADWLNRLLQTVTPEQIAWLAGYFTAINSMPSADNAVMSPAADAVRDKNNPDEKITILYGSQTGNGERISSQLLARLKEAGYQAELKNMLDYRPNQLKNEKFLLIVVSTHGEGDPPDNAVEFYEYLHSKRAPKLDKLDYSVLALGDTSYEHFCKTGRDFDSRLSELGACSFAPRVDCDVDYESDAGNWMENIIEKLKEKMPADQVKQKQAADTYISSSSPVSEESEFSKQNPFPAPVMDKILLNGRGSQKKVYHIELSIDGSELSFEPGDSVGVIPRNDMRLVDELLEKLAFDPEKSVKIKDTQISIREAFTSSLEITTLTRPFVKKYAAYDGITELHELANEENSKSLTEFIYGREIIDLVDMYPLHGLTEQDFVDMLRKLPPRLYSIASSGEIYPDEIHLTVKAVRFHSYNRNREGVCSTFLSDFINPEDTIPIYIDRNNNFKLPHDPSVPVIMIGPGTGVAPFRAFMQHREALGKNAKNWLFFGDWNFTTDFLYQTEWQQYLKNGQLTRMDVAFSRDAKEKLYVQHKMLENSRLFYDWLQQGANVYVCGDKNRMAKDVHNAIIQILISEGGMGADNAEEYVKTMQREKRYQRDIY